MTAQRTSESSGAFDRETVRARVLVSTVLPLLEILSRARPEVAQRIARASGTVQIEASGSDVAARLCFGDGAVRISQGEGESDVRAVFADVAALNAFFAGRAVLPRLVRKPGAPKGITGGIGRARLLVECLRLLVELRVLEPPSARARAQMTRMERALRVRLVLEVVTRALSRLHREGWEPIVSLAETSPDRVYQWSVGDADIAVWLRMREGRVRAGRGIYTQRRPFVHFSFPDVDAAFDVLTTAESSMKGFRGGRVETYGSPEYARKMGVLLQRVDELLAPH
jgi:hypothetical protein